MIAPKNRDDAAPDRDTLNLDNLAGKGVGFAAPVDTLIIKVASRCNIACTYCYWFRDSKINQLPKRMGASVRELVANRIEEHVLNSCPKRLTIVLHGGEPLLLGKAGFWDLCERIRAISTKNTDIRICVTTNGLLVDEEWVVIFLHFGVSVTVSLDGPPEVHDAARIDLRGHPTHSKVVEGIRILRKGGIEPFVLCVGAPNTNARALLEYFANDLCVRELDVLIPDATHQDDPEPIGPFLRELFSVWWERFAETGLAIRLLDAMILGTLGRQASTESIGFGPIRSATITVDGRIEAHDVCKITGAVGKGLDLRDHSIDEIRNDPSWIEILNASVTLHRTCVECRWRHACGGGHIAGRWSTLTRFDNPNVYCGDLQETLDLVWACVRKSLD